MFIVQTGRQQPVLQREGPFDEAGHTRGGVGVADVSLHRTDGAIALLVRLLPERPGQGLDFDKNSGDRFLFSLDLPEETINIDDNFFELGGHSLKVTEMVSLVRGELNAAQAFAEVFEKPVIRELAAVIRPEKAVEGGPAHPPAERLQLLRKGTDPSNHLFMIHAGSGEVEVYVEFCMRLSPRVNCWGVRAAPIENHAPVNVAIEALAAAYVREIRRIQPAGPYVLFGWCNGGTIGREVVRRLEATGERARLLAVINTVAPDPEWFKDVNPFDRETEIQAVHELFDDPGLAAILENHKGQALSVLTRGSVSDAQY